MPVELLIEAAENQIRERCMVLADAGLVAVDPDDNWRCELTTDGKLYLDGEMDVDLFDSPRSPGAIGEEWDGYSPDKQWSLNY